MIPKAARETALAHAFINFLHDPDVAAENIRLPLLPVPEPRRLREARRRRSATNPAIFLDPEVQAKSEVIRDLGADNAKYVKVWDEIKAAK